MRTGLSALAWLLAVLLLETWLEDDRHDPSPRFQLISFALALATLVFVGAQSVKRARDIGWPDWVGACAAVPCLGAPAVLLLLVTPGSAIENQHGPPPGANGRALTVTAWIVGVLWLAVFVAAPRTT